jgi:hypothetical protein
MALIGRSDCHYQHQFDSIWQPTLEDTCARPLN